MNIRSSLISCFIFCCACNNIEDAKPSKRSTFIHFYESPHNRYGVLAEPIDEGYLILANETLANGNQNSVLFKTDKNGEVIGNELVLPYGYSKDLKVAADGYYIIGDSIKSNLESNDVAVADLIIYATRVFKISNDGTIVKKIVLADTVNTSSFTDFHGDAVNLDNQGNLIALGTYKEAGVSTFETPYLMALHPSTLDTVWFKNYNTIDRDYVNARSICMSPTGKIVWAAALLKENQNFSRSYLAIPYVKEKSTFENFNQYGETTDQQLFAHDIRPAKTPAFGFGVIGTYASPVGSDGNLFFMRIDQYGNIIENSEKFFDGALLKDSSEPVDAALSSSDDTGDAITATEDGGFVLAGTMRTTLDRGNGGKDILIIKLDGFGNAVWNKVIGGAGDESVNSIRETEGGDLLICGSNNLSGLSSIVIIKTDKNGELKN